MKQVLNFAPTFNKTAKTLDFSGYTGFDIRNLLAVINNKAGVIIYAQGVSGKGYSSFAAGVVTLSYDTSAQANTDSLTVLYDTSDIGTSADSAATTDTGTFSLIALIKRLLSKFTVGAGAATAGLLVTASNAAIVTGGATLSTANLDLLTNTASGWYDASAWNSASVTVVGSAGISAGAIIFEQTNDTTAAASGTTMPVQESAVVGSSSLIGAQTIAASTVRTFVFPVTCKYVRCRISTGFTGGTVQAIGRFSQLPLALTASKALNNTAADLNATVSVASIAAALAAGTNLIGGVKTPYFAGTATLTRPANTTAYTAGDAVTDTGAGSVSITVTDVNDDPVSIERLLLTTADTGPGTAGAQFEAWIYAGAATPNADNAAFSPPLTNLIGVMQGTFKPVASGSMCELTPYSGRIITKPTSGATNVRVILKTLTAFTPSANSTAFAHTLSGFRGRA